MKDGVRPRRAAAFRDEFEPEYAEITTRERQV